MADVTQQKELLKSILVADPSPNEVKAQAWDSFLAAKDAASFRAGFDALPLDNLTKRQIYYLKFPQSYKAAPPDKRDIGGNRDLLKFLGVQEDTRPKSGLSTDPSTREYAALRAAEPPKPKDAQPVAAAPPAVDPAYAEFDKKYRLELPNLATRIEPREVSEEEYQQGRRPAASAPGFGVMDWLKMSVGDRDAAKKVFEGIAAGDPRSQPAAQFATEEFSKYQDRQETPMIPLSKMFADQPASNAEEYFKRMAQAAESLTTPAATKIAAGLIAVPELAALKSVSIANSLYRGMVAIGATTAGVQSARSIHSAVEKMVAGDTQGAAGDLGQATFEGLMAALLSYATLNGFQRTAEWARAKTGGRPPDKPPVAGAKPPKAPEPPLNLPKSALEEIVAATEEALGGAKGGSPTTVSGPGIRTGAGDAQMSPAPVSKPTLTLEKEPPSSLLGDIIDATAAGKGKGKAPSAPAAPTAPTSQPPATPVIDAILEAAARGVIEEVAAVMAPPTSGPAAAGAAATNAKALASKAKKTLDRAKGKVSPETEKALEKAISDVERAAVAVPTPAEPPRPAPDVPAIPVPPVKERGEASKPAVVEPLNPASEQAQTASEPAAESVPVVSDLSPEDQADELDQFAAMTRGVIADIQANPKLFDDPDEVDALETLLREAKARLDANTAADPEVRDDLRATLDDFNSMVTKRRPTLHGSATTQINLPKDTAEVVREASRKIDEADLVGRGREVEPHITVKYGLTGDSLEKVKKVLADMPPITVKLGKTSLFEGEEQDVVKVDVDSPELHAVHEAIKNAVPNEETYPEYKPHVTVAYVKPGAGKKYAGQDFADGRTLTVDTITFGSEDGKATPVKLGGVKPSAMAPKDPPPPKDKEAPAPVKDVPIEIAEPPKPLGEEKTPLAPKMGGGTVPVPEPKPAPQGSTFQQAVKQPVSVKEPPKPIAPAKEAPKPEEPKATAKPSASAPAPTPKREPKKWELAPTEKKNYQDFRRILNQLESGDTLPIEGGGEAVIKDVEAFLMTPVWPPGAKGSREVTGVTVQAPDGSEKRMMGDGLFDLISGKDGEVEPPKTASSEPPAPKTTTPASKTEAAKDDPAKSSIPLTLLKTNNTKTGAPIFAVQLPKKYPDDVYDRLKDKATELGGYWSRFPASKGFHFKTEEAANKMMEAFGNTVPGKMAEPPKPLSTKAERPAPDAGRKEEQSDATSSTIKAGEQGDAAEKPKPAITEKSPEAKAGGAVNVGAPDRGALAGESAEGDEGTGEVRPTRVGDGGVGGDAHPGDAQRDGKRDDAAGGVQHHQPDVPVPTGGERGPKPGSGSGPRGGAVTEAEPKTPAPKPPKQPDHVIKDEDGVGAGGERTRANNNLAAIRLLKQLEKEGRKDLSDAERKTLSLYSGWGGLRAVFHKPEYSHIDNELYRLLGWQDRQEAMDSTANANYTSPEVIKLHWELMRQLGVKDGGRWLESSGGVGLYLGLQPLDMTIGAKRSAVELDPTSGKIMQLLYPNANVSIKGFEKSKFPQNFFDYAVTNVPFSDVPIFDPAYKKQPWMLKNTHNFFIGKNIDLTKPGGIVSVISTSASLDSVEATKFREEIAKQADFIGAIRLPENTFAKNAGASVTTDILIFRKRFPDEAPGGEAWTQVKTIDLPTGGKARVNEYFINNPDMVLGEFSLDTRYGRPDENTVAMPSVQGNFTEEAFRKAMARLPKNIFNADKRPDPPASILGVNEIPAAGETRDDGFAIKGGQVYRRHGEIFKRVDSSPHETKVIGKYLAIRDALREVHRTQMNPAATDFELKVAQRDLKEKYDAFVKEFGYVNDPKNERIIQPDADSSGVLALEHYTAWKERIPVQPGQKRGSFKQHVDVRLADVFKERVIPIRSDEIKSGDPKEAIVSSMNLFGRIHWGKVEEATGMTKDQITTVLKGELFLDPNSNEWQTASRYLAGNVKEKLAIAVGAAKVDPAFKPNVEALRAVIPEDRPIDGPGITITLGANWIPPDVYAAFIKHIAADNSAGYSSYSGKAEVKVVPELGAWSVTTPLGWKGTVKATERWGTGRVDAIKLIEMALNQKSPVVYDRLSDGSRVKNPQATVEAQVKQEALRDEFARWVKQDYPETGVLQRLFNDRFNAVVHQQHDGSHLTLPGMSTAGLRGGWPDKHQLDAIARAVQEPSTLIAHPVGYGKTLVLTATMMEWRRLGLAKKPLMMVPNSLVAKTRAEILERYPQARVLTVTSQDVRAGNREKVVARISTGNYDVILMSDETFKRIPSSPEMIKEYYDSELAEIDATLREMAATENLGKKSITELIENPHKENKDIPRRASVAFRELLKHRRRVKARLDKALDQSGKDKGVEWEKLGIDGIIVDEAHMLKNLAFATKMSGVKGIQNEGNQLTADFSMKVAHIRKMSGGRNVVLATGTPILNSMGELYAMMRYLVPEKLKEMGVHHFDAWASTFGRVQKVRDIRADNKGFKVAHRFSRFVNGQALVSMLRDFMDLPPADTVKIPVPELKGGKRAIVVCEGGQAFEEFKPTLTQRIALVDAGVVDKKDDNHLKITSDARKAAMDMRLIDPSLPASPTGKAAVAAERIFSIWEGTKDERGTQLVFADLSIPNRDKQAKEVEAIAAEGADSDAAEEAWLEGEGEEAEAADIVAARFSVYEDIRSQLIRRGVPANEIAFIHDYKTRADRIRLTAAMNKGHIRVLLGSTAKMGVGMNVQERLAALHHLDAPWRPGDLMQREGRILRQGNTYKEVEILNYVTSGSFDSMMYNGIERKARFIMELLSGRVAMDEFEDVDDMVLSSKQIKLMASGDPDMEEYGEVEAKLMELGFLRQGFDDSRASLRFAVGQNPSVIKGLKAQVADSKALINRIEKEHPTPDGEFRIQTMKGKNPEEEFVKTKTDELKITEVRTKAGEAILAKIRQLYESGQRDAVPVAMYRGVVVKARYDHDKARIVASHNEGTPDGQARPPDFNPGFAYLSYVDPETMNAVPVVDTHSLASGSPLGLIQSIENRFQPAAMQKFLEMDENKIVSMESELESALKELERPWEYQAEYDRLMARNIELRKKLGMDDDQTTEEEIGAEGEEGSTEPPKPPSTEPPRPRR